MCFKMLSDSVLVIKSEYANIWRDSQGITVSDQRWASVWLTWCYCCLYEGLWLKSRRVETAALGVCHDLPWANQHLCSLFLSGIVHHHPTHPSSHSAIALSSKFKNICLVLEFVHWMNLLFTTFYAHQLEALEEEGHHSNRTTIHSGWLETYQQCNKRLLSAPAGSQCLNGCWASWTCLFGIVILSPSS